MGERERVISFLAKSVLWPCFSSFEEHVFFVSVRMCLMAGELKYVLLPKFFKFCFQLIGFCSGIFNFVNGC